MCPRIVLHFLAQNAATGGFELPLETLVQSICRIHGFAFAAGARAISSQEESECQNPATESAAQAATVSYALGQAGCQSYGQVIRQISAQRPIDHRQYRLGTPELPGLEEIMSPLTRNPGQLRSSRIEKIA
jgi:hypothetical protein